MVEEAAAVVGAKRRWAAERQHSEKPAVEPPGAQRTTFTHMKQPNHHCIPGKAALSNILFKAAVTLETMSAGLYKM